MSKINTNQIMSEFSLANCTVLEFCKQKGISRSAFYKHKHAYEDNKFIDVTNLVKYEVNSTIKISFNNITINVDDKTDFNLLRKIIIELTI